MKTKCIENLKKRKKQLIISSLLITVIALLVTYLGYLDYFSNLEETIGSYYDALVADIYEPFRDNSGQAKPKGKVDL